MLLGGVTIQWPTVDLCSRLKEMSLEKFGGSEFLGNYLLNINKQSIA